MLKELSSVKKNLEGIPERCQGPEIVDKSLTGEKERLCKYNILCRYREETVSWRGVFRGICNCEAYK